MSRSKNALQKLAADQPNLYYAALPGYARNFSRDSLTYGLLADDIHALEAQVAFCAKMQGSKSDPITGEEPGKVHHELPGVEMRGKLTTYNACDTTALFLLAIARLAKRGNRTVLDEHQAAILRAVQYILSHIRDGIFYEDVRQSGAERFALKVTYWKDSELNADKKEPAYPAVYSLAHFQNKAALQEIGQAMHRQDWQDAATRMLQRGLEELWAGDHFITALDGDGHRIDAPNSDSLHALLYIEPEEIGQEKARAIEQYSEQLTTTRGYLPAIPQVTQTDTYHTKFVWVHEQALLHAAASRHGLRRAQAVAARVMPALGHGFPELLDPSNNFEGTGNPIQLWSVGAYLYFKRLEAKTTLQKRLSHRPALPTDEVNEKEVTP